MRVKSDPLSCAMFQNQLPELVSSGRYIASHSHLLTCVNCSTLLADLESIAAAARQLFPIEDPPDDLWNGIQLAIEQERTGAHPC